ncbi:MAG: hypothetical protein ACLU37_06870 [Collinsella sp.]
MKKLMVVVMYRHNPVERKAVDDPQPKQGMIGVAKQQCGHLVPARASGGNQCGLHRPFVGLSGNVAEPNAASRASGS